MQDFGSQRLMGFDGITQPGLVHLFGQFPKQHATSPDPLVVSACHDVVAAA